MSIEENNLQTPIDEAGIRFDKEHEFPKDGNALLLVGGAGSGKSFILNNLLLFNGKVFNIDDTQETLLKYLKKHLDHPLSLGFGRTYGKSIADIDMSTQNKHDIPGSNLQMTDTEIMHNFADKFHDSKLLNFFRSANGNSSLPNVVFDITGKSIESISKYTTLLKIAGYSNENIHIAWVVNIVANALANNLARDRFVPAEILLRTHIGVKKTMLEILNTMSHNTLKIYMDGYFWIVFNASGVDNTYTASPNGGGAFWTPPEEKTGKPRKPAYFAACVKKPEEAVDKSTLTSEVQSKLASYLRGV